MGFYFQGTTTKFQPLRFLPLALLPLIILLSACQNGPFSIYGYHVSVEKNGLAYCENLARSVASQYDPKAEPLWFYEFGKNSQVKADNRSHYVNDKAPDDAQFVDFTALSFYDAAYQHQGLEAVISLCLERNPSPFHQTDVKLAYHTQ